GTITVLILMTGTNLVSGTPQSAFPEAHFNWFPFTTTALISVPAGFLTGIAGTLLTHKTTTHDRTHYEATETVILAGPPHPRNH
ncbi:cation acetate symporter, partial [Streptomyces sp. NPDC127084]